MKKVIRLTETELTTIIKKVIQEQQNSTLNKILNRVKNNPTFKKIQSLYDKDVNKFVSNVVNAFPKLKNKQTDLLNLVNQGLKNPEAFASKHENELNQQNIQEQAVILTSLGVFALLVIIATIAQGPKTKKQKGCVTSQEPTDLLKKLVGKTVNLYNDESNEYLYGRDVISSVRFEDCGSEGQSKIIMYTPSLGKLQISCLLNSQKIDSRIISLVPDAKGNKFIETIKYNKPLTDEFTKTVAKFCVKPSADFAMNSSGSSSGIA